jgi:hypothetical protein
MAQKKKKNWTTSMASEYHEICMEKRRIESDQDLSIVCGRETWSTPMEVITRSSLSSISHMFDFAYPNSTAVIRSATDAIH